MAVTTIEFKFCFYMAELFEKNFSKHPLKADCPSRGILALSKEADACKLARRPG